MYSRFSLPIAGRERSRTADVRLGVILAFVAGAINAGGFLAVGQYTSHMTGIISAIGDSIALNHIRIAGYAFLYVLFFGAGAATTALLVNWARQKKLHSEYALGLLLEASLLLVFGLGASFIIDQQGLGIHGIILLLCFIMGLQNAVITKISRAEIRTTHMTGIVTDLGIEIGRFLYGKINSKSDIAMNKQRAGLHASLLAAFLSGAVIGAVLFKTAGFIATVPFAFILGAIAAGPVWEDIKAKLYFRDSARK